MTNMPTGMVTFLFTDIEGSTRLWEAEPDVMRAAIHRHDEIVVGTVEDRGGVVFKHTGDGVCSAFDDPVGAIHAAVEVQRRLISEPWDDALGPLRVRAGVHTGTAQLHGDDYRGPALNRVARLMAAGHGEQVLVSAAVERLVRGLLPGDIELVELGQHRLRDLSEPEQVFQLHHPELRREFPPVRAAQASPGNLPQQLTSFIGREREVDELVAELGRARLVTLMGVGGVGKTRLALQAAADALVFFPDGIWFVELAAVDEPLAVGHAVASAAGIQELAHETVTDSVVDALRTRRCLILLDNCEHVLRAAGDIAEQVVRSCPHVVILATSREPLGVEGERVWTVASLAVPDVDDMDDIDGLTTVPSVALFVERARWARPDFEITVETAEPVAEICRRLDGVPLALELAAARVRSMGPTDIAARLDQRFRLLRGGRRTVMERHQTLRATVEWSYELLDDRERCLFDRISVFVGGFDLHAVEEVCSGDPIDELDVADLVAGLGEKSMLTISEQSDGTTRYDLLETLRQYGAERLVERGEVDEIGRRHAVHAAALAARAGQGLMGPDEARWVEVVERELDNFRAAHGWAMTNGHLDIAASIPIDLHPFAQHRLRPEPYGWAEEALELTGMADHAHVPDLAGVAAFSSFFRGDHDRAIAIARNGLEIARRRGDPPPFEAANALLTSSFAIGREEDPGTFAEAMERARDAGDHYRAAWGYVLGTLGNAYAGAPDSVDRFRESASVHAERCGAPTMQAWAEYATGEVTQDTDPDGAVSHLERAINLAERVHSRYCANAALVSLASVKARYGDAREALELLQEAVDVWHRGGHWRHQWTTLHNVIELFGRLGRGEAAVVLDAACQSADTTAVGPQLARLEALRGQLAARLGTDLHDNARRQGATMTGDEAVEFARTQMAEALEAL